MKAAIRQFQPAPKTTSKPSVRRSAENIAETVYNTYLNSLAPSGRKSIASLLNLSAKKIKNPRFAGDFHWTTLNYGMVSRVRFELINEGYSISTVNTALAALKGISRTAFNMGMIDADTVGRIQAVKRVKGCSAPKGRCLSTQEIRAVLSAAKQHKLCGRRARDRALVLVALGAGLRAAEIVALQVRDFDAKSGVLHIQHGKGRKYRSVHVASEVTSAIKAWLKHQNHGTDAVFTRVSRAGQIGSLPLSKAGLESVLTELRQLAQVERFTPHDLRRTFITQLLDRGIDINTVRQLAGHSDISTTVRYDFRSERARVIASRTFSCW